MFQDQKLRRRWIAHIIDRSGDLLALGGGIIGIALIAAVILVGVHERQAPFRAMTPAEQGNAAP